MRTMKTALILGATSDIANACSEQLAQQGYRLQLAGRNETSLNTIKSDLDEKDSFTRALTNKLSRPFIFGPI